jgi:hypothetical protein
MSLRMPYLRRGTTTRLALHRMEIKAVSQKHAWCAENAVLFLPYNMRFHDQANAHEKNIFASARNSGALTYIQLPLLFSSK